MATHSIPILGFGTKPDDSGDVFFEPYSVKATNDVWDRMVGIFNDTATRLGLDGGFMVPKNYVGSPAIIPAWVTVATTGDVEWDFDYRAVAAGESMDQAGTQESVNTNDTAGASAHLLQEASLSLTAANLSVDDMVQFTLFRDGTDAGDTIAAAVILFGLYFQYSDA